jgi:formate dehydrogenase subunit gamma
LSPDWKSPSELVTDALCQEVLERHWGREGALLPILHDIQHRAGHVPAAAVPLIAEALNLSRAEVHGVVSFYHDFRPAPAGRTVVKLCQAEACQARGCRELSAHAEAITGLKLGETTRDGALTLEAVYCLGLCASGPSALVDGQPVARLTPESLERLIDEAVR